VVTDNEIQTTERDRVVVGADGSPGSVAALRFGLDAAARAQADVDIVICWHPPYLVQSSGYAVGYLTPDEMTGAAQEILERLLATFAADVELARAEGRTVHGRLLEGAPGPTLVTESKGAAMLVVGRRGHGGVARFVLGSVSSHAAHHGTCPVVVVPEPCPS
jgi:nucleotide-binding universal stress UspA family protein